MAEHAGFAARASAIPDRSRRCSAQYAKHLGSASRRRTAARNESSLSAAMQSRAASAMDGSESVDRTVSSSAKSSAESFSAPEMMSIFCSSVAWPARTAARSSALMGVSGGGFQILLSKRDGTRLRRFAGQGDSLSVQIHQNSGGFARNNLD